MLVKRILYGEATIYKYSFSTAFYIRGPNAIETINCEGNLPDIQLEGKPWLLVDWKYTLPEIGTHFLAHFADCFIVQAASLDQARDWIPPMKTMGLTFATLDVWTWKELYIGA